MIKIFSKKQIFSKVIASAMIVAVAIGFNGCLGSKPIITNTVNQLDKVNAVTIAFPRIDPVTMEKLQVKDGVNLSKELQKLSTHKKYKRLGCNKYGVCVYKGVQVNKNNNIYTLTYVSQSFYRRSVHTKSNTLFDISVKQKDNEIMFSFPLVSKTEKKTSSGSYSEPLASPKQLENDMKQIFSKLNIISFSKTYELNEEINSKYPAQSIYANFKRILGNYRYRNNEKISESKKENTFNLKVNGKSLPLYVEVFPYREGSKVKYSTKLPYKISQGGSTLTKKDIEYINAQVINIVND